MVRNGIGTRRRAAGALGALSLLLSTPALGQSVVPGPADPALIERRFEPPEQPRSGSDGIRTPERGGSVAPEGAEAVTFTLRGVEIEGATAFRPEDLRPLYADWLGNAISVKAVYELAAAITARYTAAGYVLSQAIVPPQIIGEDGIVRLRMVEGYVHQVLIRGEVEGPERLLRAYGDKIRSERPLRLQTLERYLLLASDLPGVSASGTLAPSATEPGAADLIFEVRHKSVDAVASLDNRGSRYVGPWQATAGLNLNSVFGLYEQFGLLLATTPFQAEELKYGRLVHEHPLNGEGTKISADAGYIASHPGYSLKEAAVRSHSKVAGLGISHPLLRSRAENLTVRGRAEARNAETLVNVDDPVSKDAVRAVRLGGSYDWVDSWTSEPAVSLIAVEFSQGLDVLGARPTGAPGLSVANGHSDFFKATVEMTRSQRLHDRFSVMVALSGQWAAAPLLSAEQMALGGGQYGRGYDPAEITGDHGIAGKVELRYTGPELPFVDDWQVYGFWDGGRVWLDSPPAGAAGARDLASAGLGLRSNLTDRAALSVELAAPLTHKVAAVGEDSGKDIRGYLGLVVRY